MGIYLPNMEMPRDCMSCQFGVDGQCVAMNPARTRNWSAKETTNYCPLVPVPPHGRLGDLDALRDVQQADADFFKGSSDYGEKCRYDEAINAVANIVNAPTIIPASEEGE